jgi:hypothetical protein
MIFFVNRVVYIYLFLVMRGVIPAQSDSCRNSLAGKVVCTKLNEELGFATIYFKDNNKEYSSNEKSHFYIDHLCNGPHHLIVAYVGHKTLDTVVTVTGHTKVIFNLLPDNDLKEVVVEGHHIKKHRRRN